MSLLSPISRAPSMDVAGPSRSTPSEYEMDAETSALIAKLALEDLNEVYAARKGKARADAPPTDEELAFEMQCLHYQQLITLADDERLAKSISDAVSADEAYVAALVAAEEAAEADRRAAEMLARGEPMPEQNEAQARMEDKSFVMHPEPPSTNSTATSVNIGKQREKLVDIADEESVGPPSTLVTPPFIKPTNDSNHTQVSIAKVSVGGPASSSSSTTKKRHPTIECTICTESFPVHSVLRAPCNDYYCQPCIKSLVEHFIRDESLFPLRCCQQHIPINLVEPFISSSLNKMFRAKHQEYSVLAKDRVYCVTPSCSKFLGSSEGDTMYEILCTDCWTSTCPKCKQAYHGRDECPVDTLRVALRELGEREGWQTCPGCQVLVELELGCYHMTCRCQSQFCYLCAAPWKNCECPQWDEARLLATAERRVENQVGERVARTMGTADWFAQVQNMAANLRVTHDCTPSHSWQYRPGGGRCEECHFELPNYLLVCRGCSILACVRCSRNRL